MLEVSTSWNDLLQTVQSSSFSRLPVFRETRDTIIGVLRVKDVVERYATTGAIPVEALMRPILQIDATLSADRVLATLRGRRTHSAIVVDAERRALGLVTIQDVLSELLVTEEATMAAPASTPSRGTP